MTLKDRWSHRLFLLAPDQSAIEKMTVILLVHHMGNWKVPHFYPKRLQLKTQLHEIHQHQMLGESGMRPEPAYGVPTAVLGSVRHSPRLAAKNSFVPQETLDKHPNVFLINMTGQSTHNRQRQRTWLNLAQHSSYNSHPTQNVNGITVLEILCDKDTTCDTHMPYSAWVLGPALLSIPSSC